MRRYLSCAETAKLVRAALGESFPGVKFSVRSSTYSGGASINVRWTDGPSGAAVKAVTDQFEGAYFDGMIDYKGCRYATLDGEPVRFGADFIFENRENSDAAIALAIAVVCAKFGSPDLSVADYRKGLSWNVPLCTGAAPGDFQREVRAAMEAAYYAAAKPSPTLARVKFAGSDEYGAPYGARGYPNPDRAAVAA